MGYSRTTDTSDMLTGISRRHGNLPIVVDEEGVGGGVIDELHKNGRRVMSFCSSSKSVNPDKYYNLRAEAWWELGQHFAKGEMGCDKMTDNLRNELAAPMYEFRNSKILIEPKEKIKERLGHSTDEADCYVMGIWAVKRVRPEIQYANQGNQSTVYRNDALTRGMAGARK